MIKCQCCHHIETSQLTCIANQLTGFYMRATLAFKGLSHKKHNILKLGADPCAAPSSFFSFFELMEGRSAMSISHHSGQVSKCFFDTRNDSDNIICKVRV